MKPSGASENATVVKGLLEDLVERGLDPQRGLLVVIDGAKALRKAEDARRQSTSLNPLSATEWNSFAYTCEYNGDTACQLDAALRAHDLAPHDHSTIRGLVRALIADHRADEAWTLMNQAGWLKEPSIEKRQLVAKWGRV